MTIIQITPQFREEDQHTSQTLTLDGTRFRLDTYTNRFDGAWYLDLYDADEEPLILGLGLVTGLDLLFPYRYLAVPAGVLFINPLTGDSVDPGLTSFTDKDVALYYQTAT
jgi:hypothetical protein